MTSMGASGRAHDWHRTIVGVLLNFNIWFNSAASETVYLLTTARDQWATFYERPCVLSSLSRAKGCAHSRPSEELWVSQPLAMWEEWLIHFQLRWTWIWIAEFELCPPSCPTKGGGGWFHNLFTRSALFNIKMFNIKTFSSVPCGFLSEFRFSQAKNLS